MLAVQELLQCVIQSNATDIADHPKAAHMGIRYELGNSVFLHNEILE